MTSFGGHVSMLRSSTSFAQGLSAANETNVSERLSDRDNDSVKL